MHEPINNNTTGTTLGASNASNASDLIATLRDRAPRTALMLAAGRLAWPAARELRSRVRARTSYTVKIEATDEIYDDIHEWVLELLPSNKQQSLVAWTSKHYGQVVWSGSDSSSDAPAEPARVRLRYDGVSRAHTIRVAGYNIRVVVDERDSKERFRPAQIIFTAPNLAAQRTLIREIDALSRRVHAARRQPVFRMLSRYGDWERFDEIPDRHIDSVILPDGQLERIIADVAKFLAAEEEYGRRCVPWHRGHLYEGPPGTGKTSVARAIASHFGMDIWYLPLADMKKDTDLLRLVSRVSPRSMLLLEDVDVFHAATTRDDSEGGVTLSGLLNALDGVATPHGLLTVLTTNTPEVLDSAVIRPGRVDMVEHFGLADADQIGRLLTRWYGGDVAEPGLAGIAPAQVVETCKRYDDPAECVAELKRLAVEGER